MRIKLIEGKQRELVELAKKGKTWFELSSFLGISQGYIRNELRGERVLLSDKIYLKLVEATGKDFDKWIVETLEDNWGRVKGGKNSAEGLTKEILFPENSENLAEFFGVMLGDGNLTKRKGYKVGTYQIRIVGDSRTDRDYLLNYVKPLIEKLFKVKVSFFKFKNENAICLCVYGKKLVDFMEEKGFKSGDKIKNQLGIPNWIKNNEKFLCSCLKGLYDTDGGIYKLNNQNSFQIVFTNYNKKLITDVRESLIELGIVPSQIYDNKRLFVTKNSELRKFLKHVGFSNFKNLAKIKTWNL